MKKSFSYPFPRPALTVDIIVVAQGPRPQVVLIRRGQEPFAGKWALPGGFVEEGETLEEAARRELKEETTLSVGAMHQIGTFGDPGRDPRGWTVSVAFLTIVNAAKMTPRADDDAAEVGWHDLFRLPPLAFDHKEILRKARAYIARKK